MENHGVLIRPIQPNEWRASGETGIAQGDVFSWTSYLPYGEHQGNQFFDTLACTHFASGHIYETFIIYLWKEGKLSEEAKTFFTKFLKDPNDINSFRVSKQFSAIVGNNTKVGNYFTVAWDTWRNIGAVPDSLLNTFPACKTWEQYHDKNLLTKAMFDVAEESKKYVEVMYQWLDVANLNSYFSTSPLNSGIPIPANHSVQQNSPTEMFNTYTPFIAPIGDKIHFSLQGVVKPRTEASSAPKHVFTGDLSFGMRGVEVYWLQRVLVYEGLLNKNLINPDPLKAFFGNNTKNGVVKLQEKYASEILTPLGLTHGTGRFGISSRTFINNKYK